MSTPNVEKAILHALAEPQLAAQAQLRFAAQAQHLFHPHKLELSASAAGACVLEKWASLHGKFDLPEDLVAQAIKMDGGTLYGARLAALFAVGFEDQYPGFEVEVEVVGEHEGIPGHVEIVIYGYRDGARYAIHMVEIKTSFWGGAVTEDRRSKHSKEFHIIQACKEAQIVGVGTFSVFYVYPAATKRQGVAARHFIQDDFLVADWAAATQHEYRRLQPALGPVAPTGDAQEAWRCISCRFSTCERNKHPLNLKATA